MSNNNFKDQSMERKLNVKDLCLIISSLETQKKELEKSSNRLMMKATDNKRKINDRNAMMKEAFRLLNRANELGDVLRKVDHNLTMQKTREIIDFHMFVISRFMFSKHALVTPLHFCR